MADACSRSTRPSLYDQPINEFVAGFIGSPSINLVEAGLQRQNGGLAVTFGNHRLSVDDRAARNRSGLADYVGRTLILGIRPEDLETQACRPDAPNGPVESRPLPS